MWRISRSVRRCFPHIAARLTPYEKESKAHRGYKSQLFLSIRALRLSSRSQSQLSRISYIVAPQKQQHSRRSQRCTGPVPQNARSTDPVTRHNFPPTVPTESRSGLEVMWILSRISRRPEVGPACTLALPTHRAMIELELLVKNTRRPRHRLAAPGF